MEKDISRQVLFSEENFRDQLDYWLKVIDNELSPFTLAVDLRHQKAPGPKIEEVQVLLPGPLARRLLRFSRHSDLTLYVVLLTAFKILLSRYSRSDEILVMSPRLELEKTTGSAWSVATSLAVWALAPVLSALNRASAQTANL